MPVLGAHMSTAGGFDKALYRGQQVGCQAIQIFTKQPSRWDARPISSDDVARFQAARQETGIAAVFAHDAYLINLASVEPDPWERSVKAFAIELERCQTLGLPYLVTHAGAHRGAGEAVGLARIVEALDRVCADSVGANVTILLETTAGQGGYLCYSFEHIGWIIQHAHHPERLGICFDTCHVFAAGYEIRTREGYAETMRQLDTAVGLDRLKAFHLNDSLKGLGSRVDRHAHIGKGQLGLNPFRLVLNDPRFQSCPMILETEKGPEMAEDRENLRVLRSLIDP